MITIYRRHPKRSYSRVVFESVDINPYAIGSLIDTILEALSSYVFLSKFWCKQVIIVMLLLFRVRDPVNVILFVGDQLPRHQRKRLLSVAGHQWLLAFCGTTWNGAAHGSGALW